MVERVHAAGRDDLAASVHARARAEADAYRHGEDVPLGAFSALLASYGAVVLAGGIVVRRRGRLPERPALADLALLAVATFRLARLITKDSVTSPLRSPFMRYEGPAGDGELAESVRAGGARKAIGELLSCPFCISQWIATLLMFGLLLAPRATRAAVTVLTAVTAADYLQFVHLAAQRFEQADG